MKKLHKFIGVLLLTTVGINTLGAQEKFKNRYAIGAVFAPEWRSEEKNALILTGGPSYHFKAFTPSVGITAEAQFDKYNGVELGVFYRELKYQISSGAGIVPRVTTDYSTDYLALRLGYKFYSKIVNAGVAFNCDLWLNGDNRLYEQMVRYGLYISVSKDIPLYKGLILEPELHFNPFWANVNFRSPNRLEEMKHNGNYWGGGVKLKYRF